MIAPVSTAPSASRCLVPLSVTCTLLLVVLAVLLVVDGWLLHYPQGAVTWRLLSGGHSYGPPTAPSECWWDYEGGWSVGRAVGSSPAALQLVASSSDSSSTSTSPPSRSQLSSFSCANIPITPQRRITFVADPFLLIPSPASSSSSAPSSLSASASPPLSSSSNPSASVVPWYVFFEQKNVAVQPIRGELGVAQSLDEGQSWRYVGELLTELTCHLSYPFVLYDPQHELYVLIPETHELREVRLYTATAAALPLGWMYHRSPLQGAAFVDCSVVWQPSDETWYIFVSVANSLHLYYTDDLLMSEWHPHPASPVYSHHTSYGRNAGRAVVFDGIVHRFAQEQTNYYGEGVRVMRVTRLSHARFEETEMSYMQPTAHTWPRHRLHHVDAVAVWPAMQGHSRIQSSSSAVPLSLSAPSLLGDAANGLSRFASTDDGLQTPLWLAVVDGDDQAVDQLLWREEGWFIQVKRALLLPVVLLLAFMLYKHHLALAQMGWMGWDRCRSRVSSPSAVAGQRAEDELPLLAYMPQPPLEDSIYKIVLENYQGPVVHTQWGGWTVARFLLRQVGLFLLLVLVVMAIPTFIHLSSPAAPAIAPAVVSSGGESIVVVGSMVETAVPTDGSVWVITAASSVYFDRVRNFVGSMHTYAAGVPVLVYDLGLSAEQRLQMAEWQNVSVRAFPFDEYPQHVRNLFSYAWKILIHHRAFSDLPSLASRVIVLDSGLELRSHIALPRIAETLARQGYWLASQPNSIDRMAHPLTMQLLNISWASIVGKQFCAGGLAGWRRGSVAYEQLVGRAYQCAMDEYCILPPGAGHSNHRHDQVVMSALVYATGRYCEKERQWREWDMTVLTASEADDGQLQTHQRKVWIAARRWHQPKPFAHRIALVPPTTQWSPLPLSSTSDSSFPNDCLARPEVSHALSDWVPPASSCSRSSRSAMGERGVSRRLFAERAPVPMAFNETAESDVRRCVEGLVLSTLDTTKLDYDDELRICLLQHHNSRWSCRAAILQHWERLSYEADEALCVAEQMSTLHSELSRSALPLHSTLPAMWRLLASQQTVQRAGWLLCDLVLTPIAIRAQQWRYYWVVLALQLLCVALRRWRLMRGKGVLPATVMFGGVRHRRYS